MRFTKRRRRRVEWVRTNCTGKITGLNPDASPFSTVRLAGPNPQQGVIVETPLLLGDEPEQTSSMLEERKSYTIRRIVGRQFYEWGTTGVDEADNLILYPAFYKWGFAVKDVEPLSGTPERLWDAFTPQDFAEMGWLHMEALPLGTMNVQPAPDALSWLDVPVEPNFGYTAYPNSSMWAPDVGKIDVKVNRKVGRDQRLFFVQQVVPYRASLEDFATNIHKLITYLDVRVLVSWGPPTSARRS